MSHFEDLMISVKEENHHGENCLVSVTYITPSLAIFQNFD